MLWGRSTLFFWSISPLAPMLVYSVDFPRQRKKFLLDLSGFPTSQNPPNSSSS